MLERLDVKLNVRDRPNLDPEARQLLVDAPEFAPLTNDISVQLFAQMPSSRDHLTAEIRGAGVLINYDWTMQIQTDTMIRCVQTLFVIVNAVIRELETPVALDFVKPVDSADRSLYTILEEEQKRSQRRDRSRDWKVGVTSSIVGGIVVFLIQWLIFGGWFS